MKRVYFIFLLFPFVSCAQTNSEFDLQDSFLINLKGTICINEKDCLYFSNDSSFSYLEMYYVAEDKSKNLIDSVEFSPYKSRLYSFKSQEKNTYVILWETEYEYFPVIIAYYFAEQKIEVIGELKISLPCQSCESFAYPIKDIHILKRKDEIEISFLKNVNYKEKGFRQLKEYRPGALKFYFNILNKEFKTKTHP